MTTLTNTDQAKRPDLAALFEENARLYNRLIAALDRAAMSQADRAFERLMRACERSIEHQKRLAAELVREPDTR